MTVAQIIDAKGSEVVTTTPQSTLSEVISILASKRIGAVVIVDDSGSIVGIVSERDIIRALGLAGTAALGEAVSRYMTAEIVTASRDMRIVEAMGAMTSGRFRHLPVVEDRRLKGLVSIGDVVKFRLDEVERERQSMLDYIGTT